jgi:transcriptional regulator with XRE-family HTH domain
MPDEPGPLVRRRQLGTALRRYRLDADMSVTEVASRLLVDPSKISRIETAKRNASIRDVRDLCEIYGISDDSVRDQLMELARGSRERAWWHDANLVPAMQTLIGIEGSSRQIRQFEALVIPGLLQTHAYAEAITPVNLFGDPEKRRDLIVARIRRQQIFDQEVPPDVDIILDEAVLRRMVGGPAVMRNQIGHLIKMAETPSLRLRVIPFSAGAHASMTGGFTIMDYAPPDVPAMSRSLQAVAYSETLDGPASHDQPERVKQYGEAFTALSDQAADDEESIRLMGAVRRAM